MAKLVVLSEGLKGTAYELKIERTTVGRLEDNAFQIAEASVSSHHCEIILRGSEVLVRDLNSTNGTFINGEQIKEGVVKPGQILRLGQIEMRLENGAPASAPTGKKQLDHTTVIPAGVKRDELQQGPTGPMGSPFAKKSNKVNKIFLFVALIVGALIIAVIVYAIMQVNNKGG